MQTALQQVRANKGSPGIDGMTVDAIPDCLRAHWPAIKDQLFEGTYQPQGIKRVEIPGIHRRRDKLSSIAYAETLHVSTISATLQSTDRHHGIMG